MPSKHPVRQEARSLMTLAWPIMGGQLAQTANGFIDTVMAGSVSALDLSVVAIGASIWVPVFLFLTGVIMINSSFVAHLHGAKRHDELAVQLQQGVYLALLTGIGCGIIILLIALAIELMPVNRDMVAPARQYLFAISLGMPGIALFLALRSWIEGLGSTKPVMVTSIIGLLMNIPLNYIFIHGHYGGPALGGAGCGYATAIVMWLMCFTLLTYLLWTRKAGLLPRHLMSKPRPVRILEIARTGFPVGISIFFEVSAFSVIALLLSTEGEVTVAAHQITLNFASLLFMIPLSISLALTVRTGFYYGEKNMPMLLANAKLGVGIGVFLSTLLASVLLIMRYEIPWIYTDNEDVVLLASGLLWYAAAFQFFDALQVCIFGVLRGVRDTRWPMLITLVAYWALTLPLGIVLAFTNYLTPVPLLAEGFWIGLMCGLALASLLLSLRLVLVLGRLKQARV